MCYLGVLPRKGSMRRELLQNAYDHNSDGWGVMYAHAGRVIAHKEKSGMAAFYRYWDSLPNNKNLAVHFRFGTSGPQNSTACHPFKVLSKDDGDPIDLYMMHNGVLRGDGLSGDKDASDTMQYCAMLTSQLRLAPQLLHNASWKQAQEALLGNPNKVVFLEGNGRWTYLNRHQGDDEKATGIWHSNTYSLQQVYSGHGKGRAANRSPAWAQDDWDFDGYGHWEGNKYVSGPRKPTTLPAYSTSATDASYTQRPWGLQIIGDAPNSKQVWWKPTVYGYVRMARNEQTRVMYRDFWSAERGEKAGDDVCTVLPKPHLLVNIKNVAKFEAGGTMNATMEKGEHILTEVTGDAGSAQTQVTLYKPGEARAALNASEAGGDAGSKPAICFCRGNTGHPEGEDPKCKLFPLSCHATRAGERLPSIAETLARAEVLNEQGHGTCGWFEPRDGRGEFACDMNCAGDQQTCRMLYQSDGPRVMSDDEEQDQEEAYVEQLFSDANLQDMDYDALLEAIENYPERAAIAFGMALGRSWAYRMMEGEET